MPVSALEQAIDAVIRGDPEAYRAVVEATEVKLRIVAAAILPARELVDDVVMADERDCQAVAKDVLIDPMMVHFSGGSGNLGAETIVDEMLSAAPKAKIA